MVAVLVAAWDAVVVLAAGAVAGPQATIGRVRPKRRAIDVSKRLFLIF
jgi:hypothetical protein